MRWLRAVDLLWRRWFSMRASRVGCLVLALEVVGGGLADGMQGFCRPFGRIAEVPLPRLLEDLSDQGRSPSSRVAGPMKFSYTAAVRAASRRLAPANRAANRWRRACETDVKARTHRVRSALPGASAC